mgnify:CR=1 FL=1
MKCKICGSESGKYPLCRTCNAKRESGEIIKCAKCGSWHYAASPCHDAEGSVSSRISSKPELPFLYEAKPSLVTQNEMAYLNCIKSVLPDTCRIQLRPIWPHLSEERMEPNIRMSSFGMWISSLQTCHTGLFL